MNNENNEFENYTEFLEVAKMTEITMLEVNKKNMYFEITKSIGYILIALLYLFVTIFFAIKGSILEAILFGMTFVLWCVVAVISVPLTREAIERYESFKRFIDWNDSI